MSSTQFASACREIGRLFGAGTLAGLGDGQLLDRFVARRDDDAFEAIVARHGPMVLAVCRSLLRDPNDVDDAFQAVFLVLVKRADSVRHRDLLGPWLHGVARRVAIRARTDSARRLGRQAYGPEPQGPGGDDLERLDERASIHDEVERLPSSYRAAIVLCYFEGRTHEEAARELGWPVGTVRGRLARARNLLSGRLARRGVGLTSGALLATIARESEAAVPGVLLESTTKAAALAATGPLTPWLASSAIVSARALALAQGVLPVMTASKLKLAATLVVAGLVVGPGAAAQTRPDDGRPISKAARSPRGKALPAEKTADPTAKPAETPAEERLRLAEEALSNQIKLFKTGELKLTDADIPFWNSRVLGEKIATGRDQAEAFRSFVETSREVESIVRARFTRGEEPKTNVSRAQFDRIEAEDHTRQVWNLPPGPILFPLTTGGLPKGESLSRVETLVKPADTSPSPDKPTSTAADRAAERLKIAEDAIATVKKALEAPSTNQVGGLADRLNQQLANWQAVADQARHVLGGPEPGYLTAVRALEKAREVEAEAKKRADSGQGSKFDYLSAQLARVQALELVDKWAQPEKTNLPAEAPVESTALKVNT
ncbi:MAG TPA: RNA polymerase sigma factor, partial [Isosphaeraceae bacterium]